MQSRRNFWRTAGWGNHFIALGFLFALRVAEAFDSFHSAHIFCLYTHIIPYIVYSSRVSAGYDASEKRKDMMLIQEFSARRFRNSSMFRHDAYIYLPATLPLPLSHAIAPGHLTRWLGISKMSLKQISLTTRFMWSSVLLLPCSAEQCP